MDYSPRSLVLAVVPSIGEYPLHCSTGNRGYFGNLESVAES